MDLTITNISLYSEYRKRTLNYINVLYSTYKFFKKRNYRKKKCWVRKIFQNRVEQGDFYNLIQEMRLGDAEKHFNYFRMDIHLYQRLLEAVSPKLLKQNLTRESISPDEMLCATLRYLASGDSMISISYSFRLGKTTVSNIIAETCEAIWTVLCNEYLAEVSEQKWENIAKVFKDRWQLPNCVGALDGKHVVIQAPPHSGSEFFNYKNHHSIILLALCDAEYKFSMVDIGSKGRQSDGGVLRNSQFGKSLCRGELKFPTACQIEYGGDLLPYYIVADEAFPLRENLMRPYPGKNLAQEKRIFNYRLSRGRRVIENCFGILVSRWRILSKPITASLATTEKIVKATVCLHNFIMSNLDNRRFYCPTNYVDNEDLSGYITPGQWRHEDTRNFENINRVGSNFHSKKATEIRDSLCYYFMMEGAVPFQWNK